MTLEIPMSASACLLDVGVVRVRSGERVLVHHLRLVVPRAHAELEHEAQDHDDERRDTARGHRLARVREQRARVVRRQLNVEVVRGLRARRLRHVDPVDHDKPLRERRVAHRLDEGRGRTRGGHARGRVRALHVVALEVGLVALLHRHVERHEAPVDRLREVERGGGLAVDGGPGVAGDGQVRGALLVARRVRDVDVGVALEGDGVGALGGPVSAGVGVEGMEGTKAPLHHLRALRPAVLEGLGLRLLVRAGAHGKHGDESGNDEAAHGC
mmetsp:Transcript_26800/g.82908  ORF Transcript_26800/g.82908 Transcript_26800/m.82908 type:complete len:270 (-) Transcript_26800:59-868(-)